MPECGQGKEQLRQKTAFFIQEAIISEILFCSRRCGGICFICAFHGSDCSGIDRRSLIYLVLRAGYVTMTLR